MASSDILFIFYEGFMQSENKAILSTFVEFFKSFQSKSTPKIILQSDPDAITVFTDINELFFNSICIKNPINQQELIVELKNVKKEYNLPLTVWITPETEAPKLEELLKENFESPGPFYGMLLELQQAQVTPCPSNVSIETVENVAQAKEFSKIYCEVFHLNVLNELQKWAIKQYESNNPTCINYIARVNGVIAGISSLVINQHFKDFKTGGFYNACVLPEFRKNGVATAMACHRIQVAKGIGLKNISIILMSDAMARGYCEQLGFKNHKTMTPYFIK